MQERILGTCTFNMWSMSFSSKVYVPDWLNDERSWARRSWWTTRIIDGCQREIRWIYFCDISSLAWEFWWSVQFVLRLLLPAFKCTDGRRATYTGAHNRPIYRSTHIHTHTHCVRTTYIRSLTHSLGAFFSNWLTTTDMDIVKMSYDLNRAKIKWRIQAVLCRST